MWGHIRSKYLILVEYNTVTKCYCVSSIYWEWQEWSKLSVETLVNLDQNQHSLAKQGFGRLSTQFMGQRASPRQLAMGDHLSSLTHPSGCCQCSGWELGLLPPGYQLAIESYIIYTTLGFTMQLPGSSDRVFLLERWSCHRLTGLCWRLHLPDRRSTNMCWRLEIGPSLCCAGDVVHLDGVSSVAGATNWK